MKIKYILISAEIVNRKTVHTTEYGEIEWEGDWESEDDQKALRQAINFINPGKHLAGYCIEENWEDLKASVNLDNPNVYIH